MVALKNNILHFSYGSNLKGQQMKVRRVPGTKKQTASLPDYRLDMNKRGVIYEGYAVANITPDEGSHVEGVIYTMTADALKQLCTFEIGYVLRDVTVTIAETGEQVVASAFVATPEFVVEGVKPPPHYIQRIIDGGKGIFTPEYEEELLIRFKF
jgi:gamma-glutamylcyclotransferase